MKHFLFAFCVVLLLPFCLFSQRYEQNLNEGWIFKATHGILTGKANVPGNIFTDLHSNGHILHPLLATNELDLQWVSDESWSYYLTFQPNQEIFNSQRIFLSFESLDTYADIFLNNSLIASSRNMFLPLSIDVKHLIIDGHNELRIDFASPVKKADSLWSIYPVKLPDRSGVMLRKAAYHYGWDWGPKLPGCGIRLPVRLEGKNIAEIENVQFVTKEIRDNTAFVECVMTVFAAQSCLVDVAISFNEQFYPPDMPPLLLDSGRHVFRAEFTVTNAKLWWPNGMGEQNMYPLLCTLNDQNGNLLDSKLTYCGIRTSELITIPDEIGESFYFRINGKPVFMKGANYIPAQFFAEQTTYDELELLVSTAAADNMNMLRVWGGGIYEQQAFYDLCDMYGIMVWQDFMFACAMYPYDEEFLNSVKMEAVHAVTRLRNHPSIVVWCGNNESDEGWHNWGWQKHFQISTQDSVSIYDGYKALFEEVLPSVVVEAAGNLPYWPSSPSTGWGRKEAYTHGDVHYWGVWWGMRPFETYYSHTGRFVSEFGFQGVPQMKTLRDMGVLGNSVSDPVMQSHQKHPTGFETIAKYMEMYAFVPDNLDDYRYISQYIQYLGIGMAIQSHRSQMPKCMGTLYWQLNDCWPVTSWSSVDYYGRKKALQFRMKDLFQPLSIAMVEDNGILKVWGISDYDDIDSCSLVIETLNFSGKGKQLTKEVSLFGGLSVLLYEMNLDQLKKRKQQQLFVKARLMKNGEHITSSTFYPVRLNQQKLKKANVSIEIIKEGEYFSVKLSSSTVCRFVELSYLGDTNVFSENYFDLFPGETKIVQIRVNNLTDFIGSNISIRTLNDLFAKN